MTSVQLASAYVQLIPSMQGFQSTVAGQLTGQMESTGRSAGSKLSSGLHAAIAGGVAGIAAVAATKIGSGISGAIGLAKNAIFGFNSTLQQSNIGFTTMLGSAQKAHSFVGQLQAFAAKTPFDFQGLVQNSNSLLGMGVASQNIIPDLTALGDSVASVGGNSTVLNNTISAFGQTMAKGTLDMGNMNQLLQGGVPNALKILASSYHVTTGEMVKMISAGKVQSADALPRLISGIEKGTSATAALGGMMDKQSVTFQGALSNIGDASTQLLAKAFKPLFDQASLGANHLAAVLGSPQMTVWAGKISAATSATIGFFNRMGAAVGSLFTSMSGNGGFSQLTGFLTQIGAALAPLIPAFIQAVTAFSPLRIALQALAPVFPVITLALTQLGSALGQGLTAAVAAIAPGLVALVNGLVQLLVPLLETPALVQAVVLGFIAWKVATAGFQFVGIITGLAQTTLQLGVNALAWVRNAAAQVASKAETLAIAGLYAGEFLANLARSGVALAVQAGQWIANTAAMAANRAVAVGMNIAGLVQSLVATGAALVVQGSQWVIATAAMIANRVAMIAGTAATVIATAATTAFGIAIDIATGPIGLIILGIAALIVGIVLLVTHWSQVTAFLTGVWNTVVNAVVAGIKWLAGIWAAEWALIVAVATTVWNAVVGYVRNGINTVMTVVRTVVAAITAYWRAEWQLVSTVVSTVWNAIVGFVRNGINTAVTVVRTVIAAMAAYWRAEWQLVSAVASTVWNAIVGFVRNGINTARSVVTSVLTGIRSTFSSVWNAVVSGVSSAWNGIVGAIRGGVSTAVGVVSGFGSRVISTVTGIGSRLYSAGQSIIQHLIDGIGSMIGAAGNAIGSVISHVASFLPHSPAERGPLSGAGWTAVFTAGHAVSKQFAAGLTGGSNEIDAAMSRLAAPNVAASASGTAAADAHAATGGRTLIYNAAPNQSLDAEADLWTFMRRAGSLGFGPTP